MICIIPSLENVTTSDFNRNYISFFLPIFKPSILGSMQKCFQSTMIIVAMVSYYVSNWILLLFLLFSSKLALLWNSPFCSDSSHLILNILSVPLFLKEIKTTHFSQQFFLTPSCSHFYLIFGYTNCLIYDALISIFYCLRPNQKFLQGQLFLVSYFHFLMYLKYHDKMYFILTL